MKVKYDRMKLMTKVIEIEKQKSRLVLKKNWKVWQDFASGWKRKRLINPIKWQRKIRSENSFYVSF